MNFTRGNSSPIAKSETFTSLFTHFIFVIIYFDDWEEGEGEGGERTMKKGLLRDKRSERACDNEEQMYFGNDVQIFSMIVFNHSLRSQSEFFYFCSFV